MSFSSSGPNDPTDSVFTFVFRALSGDSWGGTLVQDTGFTVVGATFATSFGTYTVLDEQAFTTDLTPFALEEGMVFVDWYYDAGSSQFLVTRNGPGMPGGLDGLGTEVDAAWTGRAWENFGNGGALQADAVSGPDSAFDWVLTTSGGDTLWGTLYDDSAAFAPGDSFAGRAGSYRITAEREIGGNSGVPDGTVTTWRYQDGASRQNMLVESAGTTPSGTGGLGSEVDRVWNGQAWVQAGQGGTHQANRLPDARFTYSFEGANGTDRWSGWLVDHAPALQPGQVIATANGRYRILSEEPWSGPATLGGSVWITGYQDAETGRSLLPRAWSVLGEPAGTAGLGSERDAVWTGRAWAEVGLGGALQAQVDPLALNGGGVSPAPGYIWG